VLLGCQLYLILLYVKFVGVSVSQTRFYGVVGKDKPFSDSLIILSVKYKTVT